MFYIKYGDHLKEFQIISHVKFGRFSTNLILVIRFQLYSYEDVLHIHVFLILYTVKSNILFRVFYQNLSNFVWFYFIYNISKYLNMRGYLI